MTKLTNGMRDKIRGKALAEAFDARRKMLTEREHELADKVRADALGKPMLAMLMTLPDGIAPTRKKLTVKFGSSWCELCHRDHSRYPDNKTNSSGTTCLKVYEAGDSLAEEYEDLERDRKTVKDETVALAAKVQALLDSTTTVEKLLDVWPEAKPFVPEIPVKPTSVPALLVSDINSAIVNSRKQAA